MKQFVAILLLTLSATITASAQTFLDRLQRQQKNQGKVTVTQSAAIDELVNGSRQAATIQPGKTPTTQAGKTATTAKPATAATQPHNNINTPNGTHSDNRKVNERTEKKQDTNDKATANTKADTHKKAEPTRSKTEEKDATADMEIPTVDMRKKVMANSYKVTGYRVQAFAGGNTRADRQKAEQARNNIKMNFPNEPIYVHFYSPRWICRVGNYRSYEEAHKMLVEIRKLGYSGASIVKGKITVQY